MRIAIVGFGTVGKSLLQVLSRKRDYLREKLGFNFKVVAVFKRDGAFIDPQGLDVGSLAFIADYKRHPKWKTDVKADDAIEELDCDLIVEATPTKIETGEPGLTHIKKALESGKDVVTANKGPLVMAFHEISDLAIKRNRLLRYEAAVLGAVPDAGLVRETLQGNEIIYLRGILNGTTNYILTRMTFEGTSFEIALKEAQQMGIAEVDPSYDVEGIDAACKLVILANSLMGDHAKLSDVKREGISHITPEAIELASIDGFLIKHVASIEEGQLEVAPRLIEKSSPLAVGGTLNVLSFGTDLAGEITLIGRGAGGIETASAILGDIINVAKIRGYTKTIS